MTSATPESHAPFGPRRLLLLLLFLLLFDIGSGNVCSPDAALTTDHFSAAFEFVRGVRSGCVSRERTPDGLVLHAVRVADVPNEVVAVEVTENEPDSRGVRLVLDAPAGTAWRLSFVPAADGAVSGFRREVVLSPGCSVASANQAVVESTADVAEDTDDDAAFAAAVRARWRGLTTFTSVGEAANRVSIYLESSALPAACAPAAGGAGMADNVLAYLLRPQPMRGCYDVASDAVVVDLAAAEEADSGLAPPAPVYLSMAAAGGRPARRNLTLVLRSAAPASQVSWMLESSPLLSGRLTVVAAEGSIVDDIGLAESQSLAVRRMKRLPTDFDGLSGLAASKGGSVSYVRLDRANVISMVIADDDRHPSESNNNIAEEKAHLSIVATGDFVEEAIERDAAAREAEAIAARKVRTELWAATTKECSQRKDTVLAVERAAADALGVAGMNLEDASCVATMNDTHWVLKTARCVMASFSNGRRLM